MPTANCWDYDLQHFLTSSGAKKHNQDYHSCSFLFFPAEQLHMNWTNVRTAKTTCKFGLLVSFDLRDCYSCPSTAALGCHFSGLGRRMHDQVWQAG
jgi:hypothetical protein